MNTGITERVVNFYTEVFDRIFSEPFRSGISDTLRRRAVVRQIEESADAASQSLTRFFLNQKLTEQQVVAVLALIDPLLARLKLDDIASPNISPEAVAENLLASSPRRAAVHHGGSDVISRVALHSVVQVLMLVGPVMAEWQKLNFSSTFELPRRVVNRLNQISERLDALGRSGEAAADERYELTYRDYLLQRFHRVEAGTVRMTTNLDVDLRELFVMPRVLPRPVAEKTETAGVADAVTLMDLAAARRLFGGPDPRGEQRQPAEEKDEGIGALDQVKRYPRNVIVGVPGSGKSTFLEWLQVVLAGAHEPLVMAEQQAIPLLLRVRQLDPRNLPTGAALIEKATESKDRAALMPPRWIERRMEEGRVFFMLDGLDETEPELRDRLVLPWLMSICEQYKQCRFVVSSRPVGYPPGMLRKLEFAECDLLDFEAPQISEYTKHWCTAVRLARTEPEEEARREGAVDGQRIVEGFEKHPYIRNLARNPLMLSAICLVNHFEGCELPKDRALLYKLCVEGLLHHWDQRRGIRSEFGLEEKLRVCRELALTMQAADRAEYEADNVREIFAGVFGDPVRAGKLLEHIRYRTGLLLERRSGVFAFAHLTFQEYLAARAIQEGNQLAIGPDRLVREHDDGRWQEVIALYCGMGPCPAVRELIERLISQPDSESLSTVLTEAYLSARPELSQDSSLRRRVLERIAVAPASVWPSRLERFPEEEVAPIANASVGKIQSLLATSESYRWLFEHPRALDAPTLAARLRQWRTMTPKQTAELLLLLHAHAPAELLGQVAADSDMYAAPGPKFCPEGFIHHCQAEIALSALVWRASIAPEGLGPSADAAILSVLRAFVQAGPLIRGVDGELARLIGRRRAGPAPAGAVRQQLASAGRALARRLAEAPAEPTPGRESSITALNSWADELEGAPGAIALQRASPNSEGQRKGGDQHDP